jgi:alkylation response protein AidB-like acyl-CoA dehydrogenase
MDFELSDEQKLLRDTMRSFVDEQIRPVAREWEEAGRYPEEIVATMREMGLFGLLVPEEYGGMAADMVSLAVVFEEISRGWMGVAGIIGSHSRGGGRRGGRWGGRAPGARPGLGSVLPSREPAATCRASPRPRVGTAMSTW